MAELQQNEERAVAELARRQQGELLGANLAAYQEQFSQYSVESQVARKQSATVSAYVGEVEKAVQTRSDQAQEVQRDLTAALATAGDGAERAALVQDFEGSLVTLATQFDDQRQYIANKRDEEVGAAVADPTVRPAHLSLAATGEASSGLVVPDMAAVMAGGAVGVGGDGGNGSILNDSMMSAASRGVIGLDSGGGGGGGGILQLGSGVGNTSGLSGNGMGGPGLGGGVGGGGNAATAQIMAAIDTLVDRLMIQETDPQRRSALENYRSEVGSMVAGLTLTDSNASLLSADVTRDSAAADSPASRSGLSRLRSAATRLSMAARLRSAVGAGGSDSGAGVGGDDSDDHDGSDDGSEDSSEAAVKPPKWYAQRLQMDATFELLLSLGDAVQAVDAAWVDDFVSVDGVAHTLALLHESAAKPAPDVDDLAFRGEVTAVLGTLCQRSPAALGLVAGEVRHVRALVDGMFQVDDEDLAARSMVALFALSDYSTTSLHRVTDACAEAQKHNSKRWTARFEPLTTHVRSNDDDVAAVALEMIAKVTGRSPDVSERSLLRAEFSDLGLGEVLDDITGRADVRLSLVRLFLILILMNYLFIFFSPLGGCCFPCSISEPPLSPHLVLCFSCVRAIRSLRVWLPRLPSTFRRRSAMPRR